MRNLFEEKDASVREQRKILLKRGPEGNLLGQYMHIRSSHVTPGATTQVLCV